MGVYGGGRSLYSASPTGGRRKSNKGPPETWCRHGGFSAAEKKLLFGPETHSSVCAAYAMFWVVVVGGAVGCWECLGE